MLWAVRSGVLVMTEHGRQEEDEFGQQLVSITLPVNDWATIAAALSVMFNACSTQTRQEYRLSELFQFIGNAVIDHTP